MNKKKYLMVIIVILGVIGGLLYTKSEITQPEIQNISSRDLQNTSFEKIKEKASGTTVSFYGWGGDEELNKWLQDDFSTIMKDKYNITMEIVPMDIDNILSLLINEKQENIKNGSVDMIWINGENFKTAKENDLLFGPFTEQLPNFLEYVDTEAYENNFDFGEPIEGMEAPYGKAQLVMIKDSARTPETPKNAEEFMEFAKKYKGLVTYPALPDFTGSAFIRNIIYEFIDPKEFVDLKADKEVVKEKISPALDYLKELNQYLWEEGKTFPASSTQLENMFMDNEVVLYQTYAPYSIVQSIEDGKYPSTAESFIFENGTIGNVNFIAIAQNSSNKFGALVAINEMLSPEIQLSRYKKLKTLPIVDNRLLTVRQKEAFNNVDLGTGGIPQNTLLENRLTEMPAHLVPLIEEIWEEEVVNN